MLTFTDGPAAGKTLMLRRAARFLRVTQRRFKLGMTDPQSEFDGLDQPEDTPSSDEALYAYHTTKIEGTAHMRFSGKAKGASGMYPIAEYRFVDPQPDDATMRDNKKWIAWCERQPPLPK